MQGRRVYACTNTGHAGQKGIRVYEHRGCRAEGYTRVRTQGMQGSTKKGHISKDILRMCGVAGVGEAVPVSSSCGF
jgi:hypothetical protein